jgi:Arc/MetJ-type ribon-helix-helix transcriptional regulator
MQAQTHLNAKIAKLTVKVPEPLSEEIDELAGGLNHTYRSEFVKYSLI